MYLIYFSHVRRRIAQKKFAFQVAIIQYSQRLYRGHRVRLQFLYAKDQLRDQGCEKWDLMQKIKEVDVNARIAGNGDTLTSPGLDPIRSRVFAPQRITAKAHYRLPTTRSKEWVRFLKMHLYLKLQYSDQFDELHNSRSIKQLRFKDLSSFKDICSHCE